MHSYDIISEQRQGVTVYDLLVDKSGNDYKGSAIGVFKSSFSTHIGPGEIPKGMLTLSVGMYVSQICWIFYVFFIITKGLTYREYILFITKGFFMSIVGRY